MDRVKGKQGLEGVDAVVAHGIQDEWGAIRGEAKDVLLQSCALCGRGGSGIYFTHIHRRKVCCRCLTRASTGASASGGRASRYIEHRGAHCMPQGRDVCAVLDAIRKLLGHGSTIIIAHRLHQPARATEFVKRRACVWGKSVVRCKQLWTRETMGGAYFAGCGLLVLAAAPSLLLCGWMTVRVSTLKIGQLGQTNPRVDCTLAARHTQGWQCTTVYLLPFCVWYNMNSAETILCFKQRRNLLWTSPGSCCQRIYCKVDWCR